MNNPILTAVTGTVLIAADGEDPVSDPRLEQHVGRHHREQQPPHHCDPDRYAKDGERRCEDRPRRVPALHVIDALSRDLTRNQLRHSEIDAGEHQE
jgi:hypothetical protein